MGDPYDGPPVVPLPERLDRRLRLGPFSSAREALRFVTYATVGAVVAPFTSPYVWLVFVAGGFVACVVRADGLSLDERATSFFLWEVRSHFGGSNMRASPARGALRQGLIGVEPGRYVAILRTGGTPVTYLPPVELARRFELFRDLLRSTDGAFGFLASSVPMAAGPVLPPTDPDPTADAPARAGYAELVDLLCRRRQMRRVYLLLATERTGPEGLANLELRVAALSAALERLGVNATRLRDARLRDAAQRWGWT